MTFENRITSNYFKTEKKHSTPAEGSFTSHIQKDTLTQNKRSWMNSDISFRCSRLWFSHNLKPKIRLHDIHSLHRKGDTKNIVLTRITNIKKFLYRYVPFAFEHERFRNVPQKPRQCPIFFPSGHLGIIKNVTRSFFSYFEP